MLKQLICLQLVRVFDVQTSTTYSFPIPDKNVAYLLNLMKKEISLSEATLLTKNGIALTGTCELAEHADVSILLNEQL